ncbi:MoaD/ThiS family protein [Paenibacillus silviterrae]|uniref:MoaD/ThiS family protein n=1 Tax=Paenibacillus silviterrae TaxID=3242194 RepID=UPI0032B10CEC
MKLQLLLFAGLAEQLGGSELTLHIEQESLTVEALKEKLAELYPHAARSLQQSFIAVNQAYAERSCFSPRRMKLRSSLRYRAENRRRKSCTDVGEPCMYY